MEQRGGGAPEQIRPPGRRSRSRRASGPKPPAAPPRRRASRPPEPVVRPQLTAPRWQNEVGPKTCRKCGGKMFPADWIWQKYGLCLGWRCAGCKEKVMARSLPFKGLRRRAPDPDELADRAQAARGETQEES
jgi:hypothetical protein